MSGSKRLVYCGDKVVRTDLSLAVLNEFYADKWSETPPTATKPASEDYTARIAALDAARKAAIAEQVRCSKEAENLRLLQRWRPVVDDLAIADDDEFLRIAKDNGLA